MKYTRLSSVWAFAVVVLALGGGCESSSTSEDFDDPIDGGLADAASVRDANVQSDASLSADAAALDASAATDDASIAVSGDASTATGDASADAALPEHRCPIDAVLRTDDDVAAIFECTHIASIRLAADSTVIDLVLPNLRAITGSTTEPYDLTVEAGARCETIALSALETTSGAMLVEGEHVESIKLPVLQTLNLTTMNVAALTEISANGATALGHFEVRNCDAIQEVVLPSVARAELNIIIAENELFSRLQLPSLTFVDYVEISWNPKLQQLSFSTVTEARIGWRIEANWELTSFEAQAIDEVETFEFVSNHSLQSIQLPLLHAVTDEFRLTSNPALHTFNAPDFTVRGSDFDVSGNPALCDFTCPTECAESYCLDECTDIDAC